MKKTSATQGSDHFVYTSKTEYVVRSHVARMQDWSGETDDNLTFTGNTKHYLNNEKAELACKMRIPIFFCL